MISPSDMAIVTSMVTALHTRISAWYGPDSQICLEEVELRAFPYSFFVIFPITTPAEKQFLFAKIHRKPQIDSLREALTADHLKSAGYAEYKMTCLIWDIFQQEHSPVCTAVQPFDFMAEWGAILMRKVDGQTLKSYLLNSAVLLRSRRSLEKLERFLAASVIWLKIYHRRVAEAQIMQFPAGDVAETITTVLSKLKANSMEQVNIDPYRLALIKQLETVKDRTVPVALLHDDFQYSNILIDTDGRACVLDYAINHRDCTYSDVATLMIDPQTRSVQVLTGGLFVSPGFIRAFNRIILSTYFDGASYDKDVLNLYCTLAILNKWSADEAEMLHGWRKSIRTLMVWVVRVYYARLLKLYI